MIIKRIFCKVTDYQKAIFSQHQAEWQAISKVEGFLGQIGGWSIKDPLTACIFSFWGNQGAYNYFMDMVHDRIFLGSGQKSAYTSINVDLFQEELRIPGSTPDIVSVVENANYIRTTISHVREEKTNHFFEMQSKVWNPGMMKSVGMLGGEFGRSQNDSQQFLVLSGWESQKAHQKYMVEHFQDLKKAATPEEDIILLTGEQFIVEESWRVKGKGSWIGWNV